MLASRALSRLGLLLSTTPAIRQLAVPSEACASCSLRAVITSTRPSTLSVRPAQACSIVSYPCAITGMHAHATTYMHACTHSDDSACSSRPGANLDCITCPGCPGSSSALQRRLLLAAHSTRGSERFFELLTSSYRGVDTLVDALKATQCLQRGQPSNLAR